MNIISPASQELISQQGENVYGHVTEGDNCPERRMNEPVEVTSV